MTTTREDERNRQLQRVSTRLTLDECDALDAIAQANSRSRAQEIRIALRSYVETSRRLGLLAEVDAA